MGGYSHYWELLEKSTGGYYWELLEKSLTQVVGKKMETMDVAVDGRNPANQLIGRLSYHLHWFFTSQVVRDFFH